MKYAIFFKNVGDSLVNVIKTLEDLLNKDLFEVKKIIDSAPCILKDDLTKEEADCFKQSLDLAGAYSDIIEYENEDNINRDYSVYLKNSGFSKLAVINEYVILSGLDLLTAKKDIDNAPCVLVSNFTELEAKGYQQALAHVGADVEVRKNF